jgi:hypothetical protein
MIPPRYWLHWVFHGIPARFDGFGFRWWCHGCMKGIR